MLRRDLQLFRAQKWNLFVASRGLRMDSRTSAVVGEVLKPASSAGLVKTNTASIKRAVLLPEIA